MLARLPIFSKLQSHTAIHPLYLYLFLSLPSSAPQRLLAPGDFSGFVPLHASPSRFVHSQASDWSFILLLCVASPILSFHADTFFAYEFYFDTFPIFSLFSLLYSSLQNCVLASKHYSSCFVLNSITLDYGTLWTCHETVIFNVFSIFLIGSCIFCFTAVYRFVSWIFTRLFLYHHSVLDLYSSQNHMFLFQSTFLPEELCCFLYSPVATVFFLFWLLTPPLYFESHDSAQNHEYLIVSYCWSSFAFFF